MNQQVQKPDPELAQLRQRLHHLAGDQMKAAWARDKINLALDPHEAKAIWCLSRAGVSDGTPSGLAGEVAQCPVVADLRTVRLRFSQGCLRTSDQGLKLATPRLQLVTLGFSGGQRLFNHRAARLKGHPERFERHRIRTVARQMFYGRADRLAVHEGRSQPNRRCGLGRD